MKNFLKYTFVGAAILAFCAMPADFKFGGLATIVVAQDDAPLSEEELKLYNDFLEARKKSDKTDAIRIGKEFLQKAGTKENQYTKFVRERVAGFERDIAKAERDKKFADAIAAKDYAGVFAAGKAILAAEPNSPDAVDVMAKMADNGFNAAFEHRRKKLSTPNPLNGDTIKYSQMVIDQVKGDINKDKEKAETYAYMNYYIAYTYFWMMEGKEKEAAPFFYEAMQTNLPRFTKSWEPYYAIGFYYQGLFNEASKAYNEKFGTAKELTDEIRAARANLNGIAERAADAYARSVAAARADTKIVQTIRASREKDLTEFYKIRNNNNITKLNEYIASRATTPMPDPRTPIAPIADALPEVKTGSGNVTPTTTTTTGTNGTGAAGKSTATKPTNKPAPKPAPKKNPKK